MLNENHNDIFKTDAIIEEVEASFNFIVEGIRDLNNKSYTIANNHVALQLLSSGFERLVKILLLLKEKKEKGKYPELTKKDNYFHQYNNGHGIDKMIDELIIYSETQELMKRIPIVADDIAYLKSDKQNCSPCNKMLFHQIPPAHLHKRLRSESIWLIRWFY